MLVFETNALYADADADEIVKDKLLLDANGGVPWLIHPGWSGSYDGTSPIPDGAIVKNIADEEINSVVSVGGASPTLSGGGVDFGSADARNTFIAMPPTVAATIAASNQQFMLVFYMKMPAEAEWSDQATQNTTFMNFCDTAAYNTDEDIVGLRFGKAGGTVDQLLAIRQTSVGFGNTSFGFSPFPAAAYGQVAQLAFWRDASNEHLSMRTIATGRLTQSQAAGLNNSEEIAALIGKIGILNIWGEPLSAQDLLASNFKVFRAFCEIPAISGRDPLTVLDADWAREFANFS